ncbi:50S ribosomal protein L17 [Candidatus Woesebacteria bacterium CG22_combo_CG10-13_8_21_14_all_39_10]|uniref:50S ribosomal protein L17 n=4 Tax=Candidatus Woeseibacteriota TaxID=1752722 RepID=A0A2M7X9B0_9BACT|nr:MAG: 50S ribosomal protein L17 [Candidatus Woesebacteria bacterium CG22_combo_CG10-13_8_21_14_all_39_10]PIU71749.1 MAG: 50S ribosomal protein L17 [Candidatus Woesebacteria bacterium CG06_land_8_20_14_3_00_39_27]PIZ48487.1 MAG: 50S ribosomal protein L17 [Candidatus Woesebacteria bacterium CG_4_10_14_0_2_um_filter_39_14]PJA42734.1 MAG: 50S ribosomal protein L17 [Candidatus Woesebacteria bacterium CG_4_9_14_3_um_filter_39_10]
MRKMVFGKKLSRGKKGREALLRSLIRAVIVSGKVVTTKAKAKAIIGQVDKIITLAKKGTLDSRRRVLAFLGNDRGTADRVVNSLAPSFSQRNSGYTKIILLPPRKGDGAQMARLEWTDGVAGSGKVIGDRVKEKKTKAKTT